MCPGSITQSTVPILGVVASHSSWSLPIVSRPWLTETVSGGGYADAFVLVHSALCSRLAAW